MRIELNRDFSLRYAHTAKGRARRSDAAFSASRMQFCFDTASVATLSNESGQAAATERIAGIARGEFVAVSFKAARGFVVSVAALAFAAAGPSVAETAAASAAPPIEGSSAPAAGAGEVALPPPPTAWYADPGVGAAAPVAPDMLAKGTEDPARWLHLRRRPSQLPLQPGSELDACTVPHLHAARSAPAPAGPAAPRARPSSDGGVMYLTTSHDRLLALDAKIGRFPWRHDVKPPDDLRSRCGPANRGVAIAGDHALHGHPRRPSDRLDRAHQGRRGEHDDR